MLLLRHYCALLACALLGSGVEAGVVGRGVRTCRHDELGHRILYACSTLIDKRQYVAPVASTTERTSTMDAEDGYAVMRDGEEEDWRRAESRLKHMVSNWVGMHRPRTSVEATESEYAEAGEMKPVGDGEVGETGDAKQAHLKSILSRQQSEKGSNAEDNFGWSFNLQNEKYLLDQFREKVEREEHELEVLENFYSRESTGSRELSKRDAKSDKPSAEIVVISKRDNEEMNRLLSKCCHSGCRDSDFSFLCHNR